VFVKAAPVSVSWERARGEGGLGCNGVADNAQVIDYFNCLPGNKKSAYGRAKSLCFLSTSHSPAAVTAKTKKTIERHENEEQWQYSLSRNSFFADVNVWKIISFAIFEGIFIKSKFT
jgi:hypothetical protein